MQVPTHLYEEQLVQILYQAKFSKLPLKIYFPGGKSCKHLYLNQL